MPTKIVARLLEVADASSTCSYKVEVHIPPNEWASNSMRYATREEAGEAGSDLLSRWMQPDDFRVVETGDPVNAAFKDGRSHSL